VILTLGGVRETTVWSRILGKAINAAGTPWDLRAAHFLLGDELTQSSSEHVTADLDSSNTSKGPKITVANPGKFLLDLLHQTTSEGKTIVSTVDGLGLETHGSIVAILKCQT